MKITSRSILFMIILLSGIDPLYSQKDSLWSLENGITFSHFEQQVKSKIGTPNGQKLSDISELGICLQVNRKIYKNISGGIYIEYDLGKRTMAEFNGFDSSGITQVTNSLGGNYSEFWLGPSLRCNWKNAF